MSGAAPAEPPLARQPSPRAQAPTDAQLPANDPVGLPKLISWLEGKGLTDATSKLEGWTVWKHTAGNGTPSYFYKDAQQKKFNTKPDVLRFFGVVDAKPKPGDKRPPDDADNAAADQAPKQLKSAAAGPTSSLATAVAPPAAVAAPPATAAAPHANLQLGLAVKKFLIVGEQPKQRVEGDPAETATVRLMIDRPNPLPAGAVAGKYILGYSQTGESEKLIQITGVERTNKGASKDIIDVENLAVVTKYEFKVRCTNESDDVDEKGFPIGFGPWSTLTRVESCPGSKAETFAREIKQGTVKLVEALDKLQDEAVTAPGAATAPGIVSVMEDCEQSFLDLKKRELELRQMVLAQERVDELIEAAQSMKQNLEAKMKAHEDASKNAIKELPGKVATVAPMLEQAIDQAQNGIESAKLIANPNLRQTTLSQWEDEKAELECWDEKIADAMKNATNSVLKCIVHSNDGGPMGKTLYDEARPHLANTEIGEQAKSLYEKLPKGFWAPRY